MSFGTELFKWRKAKGLTQQELAKASGVNVSYVSNLERGFSPSAAKPQPSRKLVEKFAKVLGVGLDEILIAAGYAPESNRVLPEELQIMDYDGFDKDDLKDIAEYISFKRMQKEKLERGKTE